MFAWLNSVVVFQPPETVVSFLFFFFFFAIPPPPFNFGRYAIGTKTSSPVSKSGLAKLSQPKIASLWGFLKLPYIRKADCTTCWNISNAVSWEEKQFTGCQREALGPGTAGAALWVAFWTLATEPVHFRVLPNAWLMCSTSVRTGYRSLGCVILMAQEMNYAK